MLLAGGGRRGTCPGEEKPRQSQLEGRGMRRPRQESAAGGAARPGDPGGGRGRPLEGCWLGGGRPFALSPGSPAGALGWQRRGALGGCRGWAPPSDPTFTPPSPKEEGPRARLRPARRAILTPAPVSGSSAGPAERGCSARAARPYRGWGAVWTRRPRRGWESGAAGTRPAAPRSPAWPAQVRRAWPRGGLLSRRAAPRACAPSRGSGCRRRRSSPGMPRAALPPPASSSSSPLRGRVSD